MQRSLAIISGNSFIISALRFNYTSNTLQFPGYSLTDMCGHVSSYILIIHWMLFHIYFVSILRNYIIIANNYKFKNDTVW